MGVEVMPPDINRGRADFDVVNGKIAFGLTAIKGLGRGAAEEIVRAREAGSGFKDLFDFCERVDLRVVPKAAIERLIKAGAMDVFGKRAALFATLPRAAQAADDKAADKKRGQKSFMDSFDTLGDDGSPAGGPVGLLDMPEWPELERLKFEKEALDFYISSHPLAQYDAQLRKFRSHDAASIPKVKEKSEVRLGGMITQLGTRTTKQGKRFALFRVEDFTGQARCVAWSEEFTRFKDEIQDDAIHLFEGIVEWRDGSAEPDVIVKKVITLEQARKDFTRGMVLRMNYGDDEELLRKVDGLESTLKRYRGGCPVYLSVKDPSGKSAQFKLNAEYNVDAVKVPVEELEMILGPGQVIFTR
jgi:DNA polymerase-3 subunit alpha